MTPADIVILIVVILLMAAIIFFHFVLPKIKGKTGCSSCPVGTDKKIKRAFKAYKKNKDKKD